MGLYEYSGDENVTIVLGDEHNNNNIENKIVKLKPTYIRGEHKSYGQDCLPMCIFWRQGDLLTDPGWQIGRGS